MIIIESSQVGKSKAVINLTNMIFTCFAKVFKRVLYSLLFKRGLKNPDLDNTLSGAVSNR